MLIRFRACRRCMVEAQAEFKVAFPNEESYEFELIFNSSSDIHHAEICPRYKGKTFRWLPSVQQSLYDRVGYRPETVIDDSKF